MLIKASNVKKIIKLLENDDAKTIPIGTLDILLKIIPERVRTILPGMIILHTIVKFYKAQLIKVSQAGVRDGYVYKFLAGEQTPVAPKTAKRRGRPAKKANEEKTPAKESNGDKK